MRDDVNMKDVHKFPWLEDIALNLAQHHCMDQDDNSKTAIDTHNETDNFGFGTHIYAAIP